MAFLIYSGFFSFYFWLRYCPTGNTLRYRPISLALNTGSCVALSPVAIRALGYAIALRAIRSAIALFRSRSIRALVSPYRRWRYGLLATLLPYGQYAPLSPYFACAQYGLLCRPISLTLNTGSCIALSPVGDTGSLSPRGCASLTPGCILAPFQGARGSRIGRLQRYLVQEPSVVP